MAARTRLDRDANGARATGTLRTDGASIDFVLPAGFVDRAALPLVLDPLLATVRVASGTSADHDPDVCLLGGAFQSYLVVWSRATSATNDDLRAQRVTPFGAPLGGLIALESSAASADSVQVTESPHTSKWFVAWHQAGDIHGRFVDAAGGATGGFGIAVGAAAQTLPDLGGGDLGGQPAIVCVWRDATANAIKASRIDPVTESAGPEVVLAGGTSFFVLGEPAISPANPLDRLLVTWVTTSTLTGAAGVRGLVVDSNLAAHASPFAIAGSGSLDAADPSCAGDGVHWVVAYETGTLLGNGAACVGVRLDQGQITVGPARTIVGPNGPAGNPSVAWFGGSAFVAFTSPDPPSHDVSVLAVDPFTCQDCEGALLVDGVNDTGDVAICSRAGTSPPVDEGVVVHTSLDNNGDIDLRQIRADDGIPTSLGGGCAPGDLLATCARVGNAGFAVRLRNGPAGAQAFSLLALTAANVPCGPCRIVPDLATGLASALGPVSATGTASAPLALPPDGSLVGLALVSQFVYLGNACLGLFAGTDAIRVVLR